MLSPAERGRARKHVACAVSCLPSRQYESSIRITLTYEKLRNECARAQPGVARETKIYPTRSRRAPCLHSLIQACSSFIPTFPLSPPPDCHFVPFASATLRRRLRPRSADMSVRVLPLMSRPTRRLNELAAIDKLTLARHVADLPMMRQTSPTSPSTPRATTCSSSQWADAEGSGLARRAAPAIAGSCRGCVNQSMSISPIPDAFLGDFRRFGMRQRIAF